MDAWVADKRRRVSLTNGRARSARTWARFTNSARAGAVVAKAQFRAVLNTRGKDLIGPRVRAGVTAILFW